MKLKRLFAALCAAVTAFCCAALPVNAENETDTPVYSLKEIRERAAKGLPYDVDTHGIFCEEDRAEFGTLPVYANGKDAEYVLGDVNMDGTVDLKDAILIMNDFNFQQVGYPHIITEEQQALADIDGEAHSKLDTKVDLADSLLIMEQYAYTIVGLPVPFEALLARKLPNGEMAEFEYGRDVPVNAENETDTPVYSFAWIYEMHERHEDCELDPNGIFCEEDRALYGAVPVYANGEDAEYALGDVNMDGVIDSKDAVLILWEVAFQIAELPHLMDADQRALADVDGRSDDNKYGCAISVVDSQYIRHYYNYAEIIGLDEVKQMTMQEFVPYFDTLHNRFS